MTEAVERARSELLGRGFTLTSDAELGAPGLASMACEYLFSPERLPRVPDVSGPVTTRYRSKDFMHYRRKSPDALELVETSLDHLARIRTSGTSHRYTPRFRWFDVPGAYHLAEQLLLMVHPSEQHTTGTLGLHAFRSFDNVVDKPHADGFEFGGTYVIDRTCGGAISYLYDLRKNGEKVLEHQLQPGEILLFHERFTGQAEMFHHGATSLTGSGHRDAMVIQFDAPEDLQAAEEEHRVTDVWAQSLNVTVIPHSAGISAQR